jgi:hypothetical protein
MAKQKKPNKPKHQDSRTPQEIADGNRRIFEILCGEEMRRELEEKGYNWLTGDYSAN